ncbi:helix-turn-helix domain-containing protein [Streptomyces bluensis]|uniref:helix-turn-helix domain-containing protein n=1 Tax=Streptomyces bluensis TaxID=33897 RepID=UPI00331CCD96
MASNLEVSRRLTALIEPVVSRPELLRTLHALIAADGNHARAAADLVIHRSIIDYRLRRIEALTGHSPVRVRGLQTLCTALAAHTPARPRGASASGR